MNDTFAKSRVAAMISEFGNVAAELPNFSNYGYDVYLLEDGTTIRLPVGNERIEYDDVMLIAEDKLKMSQYAFEAWLGSQDGQDPGGKF
jgi:hypothetical protein